MVAPEVHRRDEGVAASRTLTEVAVGIVQRSDGQYLLTTRPQGKAYAGYWEFPGGKLEAQESVVAALRRELQEEINITIADAEMVRTDVVDYPHALVRLHFCLITQWSGEIQMREQHMAGRQCRMATQVDLNRRSEPSQQSHVFVRHHKRRLGEVVLCGNGLEHIVRQPLVQNDHGCGITAEQSAREGIDLIERKFHSVGASLSRVPARSRWLAPRTGGCHRRACSAID